ncbi:MAG: polysaccharide biosynthesis C-terminal domain-containing protein [Thermoanaerobaculia bacterium]
MTIGVTGADGFIGWHVRCRLFAEGLDAVPAGRSQFADPAHIDRFVERCDAIVHLAGMNRGEESEIERVNVGLAEALVASLKRTGRRPPIVFSSSTHIDRETAYGRSKRAAAAVIDRWAGETGAKFTNLVLPHVFGEYGRPFYNSVVSTFCHQLARRETPRVDQDGDLELLHAQEVAKVALTAIREGTAGEIRPAGQQIKVTEMLARLTVLAGKYLSGVIPDLTDRMDLLLFNTFRSCLFPQGYPMPLQLHTDQRGALFEAVRTEHGGQAFLSTTRPGVTRGDHFHFEKVERFLVVQGQAAIRLRRMFDDRVIEFRVSGDNPVFIDMPTLHTHSITNVGDQQLLTFFWSHEIFNRAAPDTHSEKVLQVE